LCQTHADSYPTWQAIIVPSTRLQPAAQHLAQVPLIINAESSTDCNPTQNPGAAACLIGLCCVKMNEASNQVLGLLSEASRSKVNLIAVSSPHNWPFSYRQQKLAMRGRSGRGVLRNPGFCSKSVQIRSQGGGMNRLGAFNTGNTTCRFSTHRIKFCIPSTVRTRYSVVLNATICNRATFSAFKLNTI